MKVKNDLSNEISSAGASASKDVQAKTLLRYKTIAAHILKGCVREFENISIKDIKEKYIQKESFDETREIYGYTSDAPEKIKGVSNEDAVSKEGTVFFDLVFYAYLPNEDTLTKFIINLEPQNKFNPGYPLVKRGVYYGARLISAQYGTEFTSSDYGKIKKVISIWICLNPDDKYKDSMNRYRITEENVVGNVNLNESDYDVMEVIMICLHRNYDTNNRHNKLINMLSVLFAPNLKNEEKQKKLEEEYDIELTTEYRKAMSEVGANLFEYYIDIASENGFSKGKDEGLKQGRDEGLKQGRDEGLKEGKEKGIEIGIELGEASAMEKMISKKIRQGMDDKSILEFFEITPEYLEIIKNKLRQEDHSEIK